MFADAIDVLFAPCVETEVFEDGGKWVVVVTKGMNQIDDPVNNQRVVSAFILVMMFDLSEGHGDIDCLGEMLVDIPPAQKALTHRARRAFRIEDKLDAILTALVGTEGARAIGQLPGDSHRLSDMPPRMTGTGK